MIRHPQTDYEIESFIGRPSHALMIIGEEGAGKPTVALHIARKVLNKDSLEADSSFRHHSPEKGSIGIEQIRLLQKFLQLKTAGTSAIRRVVIIEDAHMMTREAQNALLKVLEEPPSDSVIILTAVNSRDILPTIYSRVQQLTIKTPTAEHVLDYYQSRDPSEVNKAYSLSNGQQGLLSALLEQDEGHELVQAIQTAKSLLSKTKFERLCMVDSLAKQKSGVPSLIKALKRIARSALMQAAKQDRQSLVHDWHMILKSTQEAEDLLAHNPNTKLLLTNLMLKI